MKRLLATVLTFLTLALPLNVGMAADGSEAAPLVPYTSADGSFSFSYPDTWDEPTVSAEDENTLWIAYGDNEAHMMVRKLPGAAASTDAIIAAMGEMVEGMMAENDTTVVDEEQSGIVLTLPNGDAVQQVFSMTVNGQEVGTVLYYLSLGDSLYLVQLSARTKDKAWDAYLDDLGSVLGSLQAL